MQLNIKSSEARRLATELAGLTGETIVAAVTRALEERLAKVGKRPATTEELLGIGRECASRLKEPSRTGDVNDLLYDAQGLPR